jgi:hypothetical protein
MKKSLNPFGEDECGMLKSAWEGTRRRTRKKQGAPEDKAGESRGYVSKAVCAQGRRRCARDRKANKRGERLSSTKVKKKKSRKKPTPKGKT